MNPISKQEIAFSENYRKVPIGMFPSHFCIYLLVLKNGEQINDSSVIINELLSELSESERAEIGNPEIAKWLDFADKRLAVLLFPNITRNMMESWQAFGYINEVPHFTGLQKFGLRIAGSVAMRLANGKIKKKYDIENEREALLEAINSWTREGLRGKKFHGGDIKPDLADVCIYGCLKSIGRFTTFSWLLSEADRDLLIWYNRMTEAIGESSCVHRE